MMAERRCEQGSLLVVAVSPAKNIISVTSKGKKLKKVKPGVYVMRSDKASIDISWPDK